MERNARTAQPQRTSQPDARKRGMLRDHGLSLVLGALFVGFLGAQSVTGHLVYDAERRAHGQSPLSYVAYLGSGHFLEATFENWESEFLQMAAYVLFTVFLFQRGSAESNDPDAAEVAATHPRRTLAQRLYAHSLSLAFGFLFVMSLALHAQGGAVHHTLEQQAHGGAPVSTVAFLCTAQFWFESFQNWQSEFLALFAMVVLSIFLRERGSPESKPVEAPHGKTGK